MGFIKLFPKIPSFQLWLLSLSLILMFLVLRSQLSDTGNFSNTTYEHFTPIRRTLSKGTNGPPVLAYWIMGAGGESGRILRLLKAIYHPRNQYLLQLDSSASEYERVELAMSARSGGVFSEFGNVDVVGESYGVNRMGASGLGAMLHAAALLLRIGEDWDWFVPLSASDYPLLTQDDILYAFSSLPKDVIFMAYRNDTAWERRQNVSQVAVDPSLYHKEKRPIFYAAESRSKPDAFQIFGGSPWMILSRNFMEHCVNGWDNFPRKLLMYLSNVAFPLESYFQTVLCNTPEFHNTTVVDDDLRHSIVQNQTLDLAINTSYNNSRSMRRAIFAGPFEENDPKLLEIDEQLLKLDTNGIVQGKWCEKRREMNGTVSSLNSTTSEDLCLSTGDADRLDFGVSGTLLLTFFARMVKENKRASGLCRSHVIGSENKK